MVVAPARAQGGTSTKLTSRNAGRLAACLFFASGFVTAVTLPLPNSPEVQKGPVLAIATLAMLSGVACWFVPWERFPRAASTGVIPFAFIMIALGNHYGASEPYSYSIFFMVPFAWLGITQPRWMSLRFAPLAAATFLAPIIWKTGEIGAAANAVSLVIPVCVLVAELLAWVVDGEMRSRENAHSLARVAGSLRHLDEEVLCENLVEEARRMLGAQHTVLYQLDPITKNVAALYVAGVSERGRAMMQRLRGTSFANLPRVEKLAEGEPIVVEDTSINPEDADLHNRFRVKSYLAMPVIAQGVLVGLFWATETAKARRYGPEDLSIASALAAHAGSAFQNARLYQQTLESARSDVLTGLGNRRAFQERLEAEVERARRHGRSLSLVLLDTDGLKEINDAWGHLAGDRVLVRLATLLEQHRRTEDGAYRVGGDEFALILPETAAAGAATFAERLRHRIERDRLGVGTELRLTVSVGLGAFPEHAISLDELFERADTALYEVKRSGGNAVAIAAPRELIGPGMKYGVDMRRVVEQERLVPSYQPIFELRSGAVMGFETFCALDPELGSTPTLSLFRAAGTMGLLEELDRTCRTVALRGATNLSGDRLLFINVSPSAIEASEFEPSELVDAVTAVGLHPGQVVIEITEFERTPASSRLASNLAGCRAAGLMIALDDFGAAGADLEILAQTRFDYVKIDMSFIQGANGVDTRRRLLRGLELVVRESGAYAIAEGVEELDDLKLVKDLGFHGAQGFLLQRPGPALDDTRRPLELLRAPASD